MDSKPLAEPNTSVSAREKRIDPNIIDSKDLQPLPLIFTEKEESKSFCAVTNATASLPVPPSLGAVLKSGVHATIAGVLLAFTIPLRHPKGEKCSPLRNLEHDLHPTVAFVILPLFAFANTGIPLDGMRLETLLQPEPFGIALGLFLGKQLGVFAFAWAAIKAGLARLPQGASWMQLYGVSVLTGIGFTMSLFISSLAFEEGWTNLKADRLGILSGSILSAIVGYLVLRFSRSRQEENSG